MKEFSIHTNVCFGPDALGKLDQIQGSVMIICDKFIAESGVLEEIKGHLGDNPVNVFSGVVPDPPTEVIAEGIKCLTEHKSDVVIAIGGGSAIDAAKAIRQMAVMMGAADIRECYAIPTTSGTGSEVTRFSVITDAKQGTKIPLVDDSLQPMVAILDPKLVVSLPPSVTADTGMDALTHAMESYVSTGANDFTDSLAEKAITLLAKFLPMAVRNGDDLLAREKVHNAACLAGMAFNTTGLGICHSIAHTIGAKFHLPHGRANAIVLPKVIAFNANLDQVGYQGYEPDYSLAAKKYQRIARICGLQCSTPRNAVNSLVRKIGEMNRSYGIPMTLKAAGAAPEEVDRLCGAMVLDAMADTCTRTNPRVPTEEDLAAIIQQIKA